MPIHPKRIPLSKPTIPTWPVTWEAYLQEKRESVKAYVKAITSGLVSIKRNQACVLTATPEKGDFLVERITFERGLTLIRASIDGYDVLPKHGHVSQGLYGDASFGVFDFPPRPCRKWHDVEILLDFSAFSQDSRIEIVPTAILWGKTTNVVTIGGKIAPKEA